MQVGLGRALSALASLWNRLADAGGLAISAEAVEGVQGAGAINSVAMQGWAGLACVRRGLAGGEVRLPECQETGAGMANEWGCTLYRVLNRRHHVFGLWFG